MAKRLTYLVLGLSLFPLLTLAGGKKGKAVAEPVREYVMRVNRSALAVVDSNVVVSLQITAIQDIPALQSVVLVPELVDTVTMRSKMFPMIFINSRNQHIYYKRHLHKEFPDALALRKKNGVDLNIDYLRTAKYEPWMEGAVLWLHKQSCACTNLKDRGDDLVATLSNDELPKIALFPAYLVPPADNNVKVREESGAAYLCFEVGKWDIKPDYLTNPRELMKIFNSVNLVKNDSNVTIRKMTIDGYASPEGPADNNLMLSNKRTEALKNYLLVAGIAKGIHVEASGRGENWEGFRKYLNNHLEIPQRARLLNIANKRLEPDEKERQMRKETPVGFTYVVKNGFPSLRCTNYTVVYTVRPFTLEESEQVFETRPVNLNLNEIYRLADKYANDEEKYYAIMRKAYMIYSDDSYINLTMAYLAIKKGEPDEATGYLAKVKACPEKTMNEGLVAYLKGDIPKAVQLVEQARKAGVTQAEKQLKEFDKLKQQTQPTKTAAK